MSFLYAKYIVSASTLAEPIKGEEGSQIEMFDADLGRHFGYQRLGLHYVTLPPGKRTSLPHAESLEEEFVFVISGEPDVWLDGYVYRLYPYAAVGFPAGTGLAHTIINNTSENVELLVYGERSKKENLCAFPVNPEQKTKSPIWWENAPKRNLGPHLGKPGAISAHERGDVWPEGLIDSMKLNRPVGWHYPGDNETFASYARMTGPAGLKFLGVGIELSSTGKRSAFPHAHKVEEEFVFILKGTASIWMNGFLLEAKAGDAVAFLPGTNISHAVINNSNEPLHYVVAGEANDPPGQEDQIFYPMHEFRNQQCRYLKAFWEERPDVVIGPHNGRPAAELKDHLCFRHYQMGDENLVLDIFKQSMQYFKNVEGVEPSLKTVRHAVEDSPIQKSDKCFKEFLIVEYADQPIGVVDLHIHHPEEGVAYLGLLLLKEELFGRRLGQKTFQLLEHYLKTIFKIQKIRLGISAENNVVAFWQKMGFQTNGKFYAHSRENKTTQVDEYEKLI